ncbi:protein PML-like [Saccostrea echinata]|uniref:protein PML-like n=1 Tax=Saccostrea echinata TaxID=191078 RepID=UPI002A83FBE9|nr:protein PML-like [Saccostrea echinata]
MVDTLRGQELIVCSQCEESVEYFCASCELDLCHKCKQEHNEAEATLSHDVRVYREKYGESLIEEKCMLHPQSDEHYRQYCHECGVPVCKLCAQSPSHRSHTLTDIKSLYREYREKYREWYKRIRLEVLPQVKIEQDNIEKDLERRNKQYTEILNRLEEQARHLKTLVDEVVEEHKSFIRDLQNSQLTTLQSNGQELLSYVKNLKNILDGFEKSANMPAKFFFYVKENPIDEPKSLNVSKLPTPSYTEAKLNKNDIQKLIGHIGKEMHKQISRTPSRTPSMEAEAVNTVTEMKLNIPDITHVRHISCVTSDRLWISGTTNLVLTDIETKKTKFKLAVTTDGYGCHSVNSEGDLIYIDNASTINKLSEGSETELLIRTTEPWKPISIHCAHSSDTMLVGMIIPLETAKVVRYDSTGQVIQTLQDDHRGKPLYEAPAYITENNGDVIVSDYKRRVVIVTDRTGKHRFSYRGPPLGSIAELWPRGVCTDSQENILVSDFYTQMVHIVNNDGHFLRYMHIDQGLRKPFGLCFDSEKNMVAVGSYENNTVHLYHYLE